MSNNNDDLLINEPDTNLLNEQISNEQFIDVIPEFEVSHSTNIIEKLLHLTRFGNLLTLVVGNNGSGKTRLLEKFLSTIDDDCQICHIKAQPLLSIDQLFQQLIESFAGETTFTGIPLTANQYEEWAEQLTAFPGNRLLIIDDAEVLSTSVLHELSQLSAMQQAKETPHLHLILFGNYDLNNILEQSSHSVLDEDGIYAIDIPSLNDEEATQWLEYLFAIAGVVFLPEQEDLDKMLAKGHGNLALLKEIADEYAAVNNELQDFEKEPEPWRISVVGYWFATLTVMILLVLGLFFFRNEIVELTGISIEKQNPGLQENIEVLNASEKTPAQELISETLKEAVDPESSDLKQPPFKTSQQAESESDTNDESINSSYDMPSETTESQINYSESLEGIIQTEDEIVSVSEEPLQETESLITEAAISALSETTKEASLYALTAEEQLLISEPDNNYAVQLIGLRDESTMQSFIAEYGISNMMYYRSSLNGNPWFIAILASYEKRSDALDARANLPLALVKHGPWIKQLKIIKGEINGAREQQLKD